MITDSIFREKLDQALKDQGLKKKERNQYIEDKMWAPIHCRDNILDAEELKASMALKIKEEERRIPSEHEEQVEFVKWFRDTYPEVLICAIPNGGGRSKADAHNLKMEGVVAGIPDLYIPAWKVWVEMKRIKLGVQSEEQKKIASYLIDISDKYLLCFGCEDAKKKIIKLKLTI